MPCWKMERKKVQGMRVVPNYEKRQRGCQYCFDVGKQHYKGANRIACPHDECPYAVLDKYETYDQYMASQDSRILVHEFFQTVASCYELANQNIPAREFFRGACSSLNF